MRLRLFLLIIVAVCGLTPFAAHAGAPGANPAAVHVTFGAIVSAGGDPVAFDGDATINRTGEMHLFLTVTVAPEQHTLEVILVDDVLYASADGGVYESGKVADLLNMLGGGITGSGYGGLPGAATRTRTALPASCLQPLMPSSASGLQALAGAGITVTQSDGGTIGGVPTSQLVVHANLASALANVAALVRSVGVTCGLSQDAVDAFGQLSSPQAQQLLTGATLNVDVYTEQSTDFPRRINLALDLPALPFNLQFRADLTPLAVPALITRPANSSPAISGQ